MIAVEPKRTALLVMDYQNEIVPLLGDKTGPVFERATGVIAAARKAKVQIIYVVVGFRPGYPEIDPASRMFAMVSQRGGFNGTTAGENIAPAVAPQPGDIVVVKHRTGAFAGTDMDQILRVKGIDTLILCGIATSGVVLSTLRHAADADYKLVVVHDCCADGDDEVHRVLTEKVFTRQASVISASDATTAFAAA